MRGLAILALLGLGAGELVVQTPVLPQAVSWVGNIRGQDALVIGDLPDPAFARVLPARTRVLVAESTPAWVRSGMEVRRLKGLRGRGMLLIDRRYFVVRDAKGLWTMISSPEVGMQVAYYLEQLWRLGVRP